MPAFSSNPSVESSFGAGELFAQMLISERDDRSAADLGLVCRSIEDAEAQAFLEGAQKNAPDGWDFHLEAIDLPERQRNDETLCKGIILRAERASV